MTRVLQALLDKYQEMLRMRERDAGPHAPDPRAEMAALARRFPGALREIDERELSDIRARIEALRAAVDGRGPVPDWAPLQARYHGAMRAFLRLRPSLRDLAPGASLDGVRDAYRPLAADEPAAGDLDAALLARLRAPPGGRLNPVVFEYVAAVCGVTAAAVEAALFRVRC